MKLTEEELDTLDRVVSGEGLPDPGILSSVLASLVRALDEQTGMYDAMAAILNEAPSKMFSDLRNNTFLGVPLPPGDARTVEKNLDVLIQMATTMAMICQNSVGRKKTPSPGVDQQEEVR